jgi:hypothetical protein
VGMKNTFIGREVLGSPDLSLRRFWQQGAAVTKKATYLSYGSARAPLTRLPEARISASF